MYESQKRAYFESDGKLIKYQEEVKANLATDEGKEWMTQRSAQAEGIFGEIKQDYQYDRFRRRGETGVKLELLLVSIGHNLRRYHTNKFPKKKQCEA
ncbi:hypothetical protein C815_00206 [Firmicutes bacterium M10-2]|nr:hypothetical protein C815_00206 [Firmicutes bacterium M10-2]